jgi:hypothetical protein
MWNGFTKCYEKFDSQVVRGKGMMCGVNDGCSCVKADKDVFGRF